MATSGSHGRRQPTWRHLVAGWERVWHSRERLRPRRRTTRPPPFHVIGVDGTGEQPVEHAHAPAWSPDGSRIAVVSDREGTNKIFLVDPDGGGFVRLTDGPKDEDPDWAPDGSRIAFDSERAGKPLLHNADDDPTLSLPVGIGGSDIYTVRADGSDVVRLTEDPSYNSDPEWSPDGSRIAFASNRDGTFQIHVMKADGSDVRQITHTRATFIHLGAVTAERTRRRLHRVARCDRRTVALGAGGSAWQAAWRYGQRRGNGA